MSRNDYDDMGPGFSRRGGGDNKKTYIISFMCILIILIAILLYIVFRPSEEEVVEGDSTPMTISLDIPEVEQVPVERSSIPVVEEEKDDDGFFTSYTVTSTDTLSSIASSFGISPTTISQVNNIQDQSGIKEGISLTIPSLDGILYTVEEGDTISSLMSRYMVSVNESELIAINGIEGNLKEGDVIFIPIVMESSDSSFLRPSDGSLVYRFNEVYNGMPLNGVAFSQEAGSAVYAIADGFVMDAGSSSQFGRFVTIVHQDGFKSSYYCLEVVNVRVGQRVKAGDVIATVGSSNRYFETPTLYFTLEQGSLTLDPMMFF